MKAGSNCCQAVLLAAGELGGFLPDEKLLAAASLFGGGMGSGCVCGALAGMIMAGGIMAGQDARNPDQNFPRRLHDRFREEFGATCCRALRKKRTPLEKMGNRACIELTGRACEILMAEWEAIWDAPASADFGNCSHP